MQRILLSPFFLVSLAVLLINDFYLKSHFGNFLTGKLSDVSGLFCFPLFFVALLPRGRFVIYMSTAIAFAFWKTPLATGLIDVWNLYAPLHVGRAVDYSDLIALGILPASYRYAATASKLDFPPVRFRPAMTVVAGVFSLFAFTATQLVRDRTVYLTKDYSVERKVHELEVEPLLRENPSIVSVTSTATLDSSHADLQTNVNTTANLKSRMRSTAKETPTPAPIYWFDVVIAEATCNSEKSKFSFMIQRKENILHLSGISLDFDCAQYEKTENINALDTTYIAHGRKIFERHVVDHLTKYGSQ